MPFFRRMSAVRRRRDGDLDILLADGPRATLRKLLGELDEVLESGSTDPGLRRLEPPAYLDDPEREAAYRLLAGDELRTSRRAAIATVLASLDRTRLTEDEAWTWLQSLNALRLVLGTQLDVSEDDEPFRTVDADDPDAPLWHAYHLTSAIQYELIHALER